MVPNTTPPWTRLYVTAFLWFLLLLVVFLLPVSLGWQKVIGCGVAFTFLGYFIRWLSVHRTALAREERDMRLRKRTGSQRDVPLTLVQAHYVRVQERSRRTHTYGTLVDNERTT